MKAAPQAQQRLLDLQELDTALDRLNHRRRTLPEAAEIERIQARLTELRDAIVAAETEVADLDREQKKAEQDVDQVRARAERDQQRLDSGMVTSAKDLSGLQSEIASLHRRQSDLEEVVLEIMERREEAEAKAAGLRSEREAAERELAEVTRARDAALAGIDEESGATSAARTAVAKDVPDDLLALYEKLRGQFGGIGAAALHRGQCQGCHLALNTVDLNRIRAAAEDEVVRCEECRRILVRTPESGL
ncbi:MULTISPECIES: zinc ribbon domain-containing protein [Thermomonospora]|uniref:Putative nucleic acid-binding Zn-ribbon protein n=1 Tax=Thermomonospora cellulosilytica TaxID=1411118 RepID=A0A7W3MZ12_9ACTN|nr:MULTISPECIES: C4-type zinc ribbon domain-containing protein [Thermomonospora]MBA9004510.1 putative nucleic acid-binding Zn-ribbon protein [Thermomonospora cellulosilytica]